MVASVNKYDNAWQQRKIMSFHHYPQSQVLYQIIPNGFSQCMELSYNIEY